MSSCMPCWGIILGVVVVIILYKIVDYLIRLPRLKNLDKKYVFITGCDTGFGHEAAKRFDALGCHVIAGCYTEAGQTELREQCSSRLFTVPLDVSKHESVTKAYELVIQYLPRGRGLHGVLNNAGLMGRYTGPADWMEIQDYVDVMSVNLLGLIDVTMTFLPLVKKERGRIVNTSSGAGRFAAMFNVAYTVSKFGVEAFSDVIRRELRPFGVSVHLIEPGSHRTKFATPQSVYATMNAAWNRLPDYKRVEYGEDYMKVVLSDKYMHTIEKMMSSRLDLVVDAYQHAMFGYVPRVRYVVGWDAKILMSLLWLPEWFWDFALTRILPTPASQK